MAGSGVAVFNLTTNANYIMNNDPNVTLHYYPTEYDMEHHTNEIMNPAAATVGDPTIAGTTINLVQYVYIAVTSNIFTDSDGYNCYVKVLQGFIVNPLPVVATIPNYQVCQDLATNNGIATFDLTSQTTALLVGNSTTPTSTYSVAFYTSNPPTPATLIIDPVHYINTASPYTQTIYVVVTNTTTTCTSAVGQFNIVVNPKPVFATLMNDFPTCDTDGVNDGMFMYTQNPTSPLTGLAGYVSDLLGPTQQTGFTVTFYENYADALAGTVANAITNLATYQVHSNMYWVRIENDVTHCFILDSFEVIVEPLPQPVIFTDYDNHVICATFNSANHAQDQVVRTLLLQVQNTTVYPDFDNNPATYPVPTYNYQWYLNGTAIPGATLSTYLVQTADPLGATRNYTVTMNSTSTSPTGGCSNPTCTPFPVIQSGQAVAIGTSGGYTVSNAFQDNQTINVTIDGWGAPDYQYSLDNGPMQTSPVFDNVSLGEHTITVWDVKGGTQNSCDPLVIEKVETINYPHYFTPNGDGIHDSWNIVGLYNQPNAKIYIFDRFGKLIKQISPQSEGWDGTYNGNTLPSTDYWFTVDYSEDNAMKQFKAHFSLKR